MGNRMNNSERPLSGLKAVPLYKQLKAMLLEQLENQVWKNNEKIPSEAEISGIYGVSRVTVRSALNELVEDGYLIKIQGKGTYACHTIKKITLSADSGSFHQFCTKEGLVPGRRVLVCESVEANQEDVEELRLSPGDRVVHLYSVMTVEGVPITLEDNRLSSRFDFLMELDLTDQSIWQLLMTHGDVRKIRVASHVVDSSLSNSKESQLLQVPKGTPMLIINELNCDENGDPVHRTTLKSPSNRVKFYYDWGNMG
ncbi:MAG TPA: GntR family transcriptional regulator [Clostridia bacterium]|nr:GntR family transcriptional regulator [Clostridia bacterium]